MSAQPRLRRATADDLDAVLALKRALPMPRAAETQSGGFLLIGERGSYARLFELARIWLLELDGEVVGYCVTLDDAILRVSPLWARRAEIQWRPSFDPTPLHERRVAYFDQLALSPVARRRFWGAALALRALIELIDGAGHDAVLTTTVLEPIVNRAALPYLARVGAREVGRLEERYPEVGSLVSAIHLIEAARCREQIDGFARAIARRPGARPLLDGSWTRGARPWVP